MIVANIKVAFIVLNIDLSTLQRLTYYISVTIKQKKVYLYFIVL